jgi:hypothetical protein
MSAAAILSRKDDKMKTKINSINGPFQSSGRNHGNISGTPDSSNIFDRMANPSKRPNRLTIIPHSPWRNPLSMSWSIMGVVPKICSIKLNPGSKTILKVNKTVSPITATQKVFL